MTEMVRQFCEQDPQVATYDVNTSSIHHISLGKAA
jgi:hypothetical protein